jgi:hypothetical protein
MKVDPFRQEQPDQPGRNMLIRCSETLWPELWQGLRAWINAGQPEPLREWAAHQGKGISDEWFVAILEQTVGYWISDPNSDSAQLKPGCQWSKLPPLTIGTEFMPRFSRPYPDFMETLANFKKRISEEFKRQLNQYIESRRKGHAFMSSQFKAHIEWTCLALKGLNAPQIVASIQGLKGYNDPEQAVSRAVQRTAKRIGLTLTFRP